MRTNLPGLLLVLCFVGSCKKESSVGPDNGPIIEPEPYQITPDSVERGDYLGIAIGEGDASVYPKIQVLQQTKG